MNAFELTLFVVVIALPLHWLVAREFNKLSDPAYIRSHGAVIVKEAVLQDCAGAIGAYMGHEIWDSVTFMGMTYRFDRVVPRSYQHRIGPCELYLAPGLLYRTD